MKHEVEGVRRPRGRPKKTWKKVVKKLLIYTVFRKNIPPLLQIDIIGAVTIVCRVRGKIVRSVLCSFVCNNCAHCNARTVTHEDLTVVSWLDLAFLWLYCVTACLC